jgi:uncharacterized protein (DUF1697 family)
MQQYISLLRGINIGGNKKILMADLKLLYANIGLLNATTYIQSGNVFFETESKDTAVLAQNIENAIRAQYGFDVPVLVLNTRFLNIIIAENPFLAKAPPTAIEKLHVTFLDKKPLLDSLENIKKYDYPPDFFSIKILENDLAFAYISCETYHASKFSNAFFEKQLAVRATTRNWKTVLQLAALSEKM